MYETRSCMSQWKILRKSKAVKSATKRKLSSSRKIVMARHVSVIAYQERSYNDSTSASRSRPKKSRLHSLPNRKVMTSASFPSTSSDTLEEVRCMTCMGHAVSAICCRGGAEEAAEAVKAPDKSGCKANSKCERSMQLALRTVG